MNLFDQLVTEAINNRQDLSTLRVVVEKEILHHDILREMSTSGLLDSLTFIGGTCLRACYGSNRLSEHLDFTGGKTFKRETLSSLGSVLVQRLESKYGLSVTVDEPYKESGNVDTWKMKVITHPAKKMLPVQKINIDICSLPSYDKRPMMLRNIYGIEMGTSSLILQAQSREEIFADKIIALALRPNRFKNRDLWDITWLSQQGVALPVHLISKKIHDRDVTADKFLDILSKRQLLLEQDPIVHQDFVNEMKRFLPAKIVNETVLNADFWRFLCSIVREECRNVTQALQKDSSQTRFRM